MGWDDFVAVRKNFVQWCQDLWEEQTDGAALLLPPELREWAELPDAELAKVLQDKLGSRLVMFDGPAGQEAMLGLMIAGAATTSPDFCGFLIGIRGDPELLGDFSEFLSVLTQLGIEALKDN